MLENKLCLPLSGSRLRFSTYTAAFAIPHRFRFAKWVRSKRHHNHQTTHHRKRKPKTRCNSHAQRTKKWK